MDVYYHRIEGFQGLDTIKGIEGYCKRAAALCHREDILLLDFYEGIEVPIPELSLLHKAGFGPKAENIFAVNFDHQISWEENVRKNQSTLHQVKKQNPQRLMPFSAKSSITQNLAKHWQTEFSWSSPELAFWGENKATLLELGEKLGHVPKGYSCSSETDFYHAWEKLKQKEDFTGEAVVKAFQSASGLLSAVVQTPEDLKQFLTTSGLGESGGVLEEWHRAQSSPSINYWIENNSYRELFISDQLFQEVPVQYGREGTCIHAGNVSPSTETETTQEEIRNIGKKFVQAFINKGYHGPIGFDTIVTKKGEVFFVEANPRTTGPHYGFFPAQKKQKKPAFRLRNEEIQSNITVQKLEEILGSLFLEEGKNEGYFLFNLYPGKFTGVLVGKNRTQIDEMEKELSERLANYR